MLDKIADWFGQQGERPNKFTRYMGERIRTAREEAGFSQEKLASLIYLRRATLSDIENGKVETDAGTLSLLSYCLRKPLLYFFPKPIYEELVKKDMDALSLEMQMQFEQINGDELKKLAIDIIKAFAKFDPKDMVARLAPDFAAMIVNEIEIDKEMKEHDGKRRKKK
jgi:transcriptional regulator with XRE-family HTH domain